VTFAFRQRRNFGANISSKSHPLQWIAMPRIDSLFLVIDFLGVFVGALGGALSAVRDTRYKYDLVGLAGLAFASALGGGITRDLILQKGPPLAFVDVRYLLAALTGAAVGLIFSSPVGASRMGAPRIGPKTERMIIVIDAAALGLFAVAGSTRALDAGLLRLPAFLLGCVTAVGGGCIRDVLSGRTPKIFERGELYAIAAAFGAAMFLACDSMHFRREISTAVGALCGFSLRLLALRFNWKTRPVRRET
jgi:uncharacterized membrane protein YeiH